MGGFGFFKKEFSVISKPALFLFLVIILSSFCYAGSVQRSVASESNPGSPFFVTLKYSASSGENWVLIEEAVPKGVLLVDSGSGHYSNGKIRWVFSSNTAFSSSKSFSYKIKALDEGTYYYPESYFFSSSMNSEGKISGKNSFVIRIPPECARDSDCNDNNICTDDSCSNGKCVFSNSNRKCNDGKFCTVDDKCINGKCSGTQRVCSDGKSCSIDSCDESLDKCIFDSKNCECSKDLDCNDNNICTDDSCSNGKCSNRFNVVECDDGKFCTVDDKCINGKCSGTQRVCSDGKSCSIDSCDESLDKCIFDSKNCECSSEKDCYDKNPCTKDSCLMGKCVNSPMQNKCDDGKFCTINDRCEGGFCIGDERECADSKECTIDTCDESNDRCVFDSSGCECSKNMECDDDNPCTDDSCNNGRCVNVNENSNDCDDGRFCTVNDKCKRGVCIGSIRKCNDNKFYTLDYCDMEKDLCVFIDVKPDIKGFSPELTTTLEEISNFEEVSDFKIGKKSKARIWFKNHKLNLKSLKLDRYIKIGRGYVKVDTDNMPRLNKSAVITMYNVTLKKPRVMQDGKICKECNIISYENNTLVFSVPHWTTYTLSEDDYCGDGSCGSLEDCSSCAYDCGICQGSDGDESCVSEWECGSYGECVFGKSVRNCVDLNDCLNPTDVPELSKDCGCVPEWACSDWSECYPGNFKNRTCVDWNNCDTLKDMPQTQMACDYEVLPTCFDDILNQGEEGVDCGGPCSPCSSTGDSGGSGGGGSGGSSGGSSGGGGRVVISDEPVIPKVPVDEEEDRLDDDGQEEQREDVIIILDEEPNDKGNSSLDIKDLNEGDEFDSGIFLFTGLISFVVIFVILGTAFFRGKNHFDNFQNIFHKAQYVNDRQKLVSLYGKIEKVYHKLSEEEKKRVFNKLVSLYNKIKKS